MLQVDGEVFPVLFLTPLSSSDWSSDQGSDSSKEHLKVKGTNISQNLTYKIWNNFFKNLIDWEKILFRESPISDLLSYRILSNSYIYFFDIIERIGRD